MNRIKVSINFICVLIFVVVGASSISNISSFSRGLQTGMSEINNKKVKKVADFKSYTVLEPNTEYIKAPVDSLATVDGGKVPVMVGSAFFSVPAEKVNISLIITYTVAILAIIVLCVWTTVLFIQFIIRVNKGLIFNDKTIKKLKHIGILMLIAALARFITGCIDLNIVTSNLPQLQHYSYYTGDIVPWSSIFIGLVSLLMARIWTMSMALKKEQELTI